MRQHWRRCAACGSVWMRASVRQRAWRVIWAQWLARGIKARLNCIRLVFRWPNWPFSLQIPAWPWEREEPAGPRRGRVCCRLLRCCPAGKCRVVNGTPTAFIMRWSSVMNIYCCSDIQVLFSLIPTEGPWARGETQHRDSNDGGEVTGGEDGESEAGGWARERKGLQSGEKDMS